MVREKIVRLIETYASAVRARDAKCVSELFNDTIDHCVYGLDENSAWNSKKETTREAIYDAYNRFFSKVDETLQIEYIHRIIDEESSSAAMLVKVVGKSIHMENALHVTWNDAGKIIRFYNWYGKLEG